MDEIDGRPEASAEAPGRRPPTSRLKRRADFLRVARGRPARTPAFSLRSVAALSVPEAPADERPARIGYTVTKKIGGAVVRNRVRRRLREAVRACANLETLPGHDYVLMAQPETLARGFDLLVGDVARAFAHLRTGSATTRGAKRRNDRDGKQ